MEESRRDAQPRPHLSADAAQKPSLDREEVDVSDLDEEEEARNTTTTTATTANPKQSAAGTPSPLAPPPPTPPSQPQRQASVSRQQAPHAQYTAMPMNLPPPPPHHLEWFQHAHAQAAAAASAATGHYPLGPPPPPSPPSRPPSSSVQPHNSPHPAITAAPFPGLRGLGLSPLFLHRHPQLDHGGDPGMHDPNKRHTWTGEEDRRLKDLVKSVGPRKWGVISTHFKNRNAKQCHQRWHYVLKPSITREPWSEEEDNAVIHYQGLIGNKWSHIAKFLPGRTGYAIRNRYNFLSKRELEERQRHLRPFMAAPALSLQIYAAAAAAAAAASGDGGKMGGQEVDMGVQQDGEGAKGGEYDEEEEEEEDDDIEMTPVDEDEKEETGEKGEAGAAKDDGEGARSRPSLLLEPLAVPTGWVPSPSTSSVQFASSFPSSSTLPPQRLPTPTFVPPSSTGTTTSVGAASSSSTMLFEPPSLAHAFASTPASSSCSAAHGTCKAGPAAAAAAAAAGSGSSLSTSLSGGAGEAGSGPLSSSFHERQYQAGHGSHSSFENAVFANLELMAMAAGQQRQVPVPAATTTTTTTTNTTQTKEGEAGDGKEKGMREGEGEKGGVVVAAPMQEA